MTRELKAKLSESSSELQAAKAQRAAPRATSLRGRRLDPGAQNWTTSSHFSARARAERVVWSVEVVYRFMVAVGKHVPHFCLLCGVMGNPH